jgi:hypothetical protein
MIASLPMYDRPETVAANDRLWQAVRTHLGYGPDHLTRGGDAWDHWQSPDLIVSQTCGYPYRARLHGKVTLVGTPVLDLPDCPPGQYYSVFVARAVAENRADIAALDALSWKMMQRHDPFAATLRVLARTKPSPTLPYICALGRDPAPIFEALQSAISGLSQDDRATLGITGLTRITAEAYLAQPNPPPPRPN